MTITLTTCDTLVEIASQLAQHGTQMLLFCSPSEDFPGFGRGVAISQWKHVDLINYSLSTINSYFALRTLLSEKGIRMDCLLLTTFHECQPMVGSRFVAFYGDGGGASLFMRDDAGNYFDAEGDLVPDADWFMDSGHVWYAYLPDDFRLWFEQKGEV